jgi:phosphopantothenoylcysteine decarboxylase/phosphopantothenate--cysteine ligase
MLDGVNVALGVTGSIAAVKTVEIAHELRRQGASVRAVMTPAATDIIHPWSLEYATENPVVTEITGAVEHVELCGRAGWADVFVVAPATANTTGKMAAAIDDSPVTTCATTAFGADVPIVVVPAMHEPMYDHPGVLEALETLEAWGVDFVDPRIEEGKAKIAEEDAIVTATARAAGDCPLDDETVVVTSGATTESIDPIRTLSNRASGRTGRAVARSCVALGADVVLVHDGPAVPWAETVPVESAAEMQEHVLAHADDADGLVSAAAMSDYTVETAASKMRTGQESLTLTLEPTPKLIDTVRAEHPSLPIVGFKAETGADRDAIVTHARDLQDRADLAFVVGNDASVMGEQETDVLVVDGEDTDAVSGTKQDIGHYIASRLADTL